MSLFLWWSSVAGRPSSSVGRPRHLVCVCMREKVQYKSNSPGVPLCTRFGDFGNPSEASYANRRTCTDRNSTQVLQTCGRCNFSCIKPIAQGSILGTLWNRRSALQADPQKKIPLETYAKSRLLRRINHLFYFKKRETFTFIHAYLYIYCFFIPF